MPERLKISGLMIPENAPVRESRTGQSKATEIGSHVLITRPLDGNNTGMSWQDELLHRKRSATLYQRKLPRYTLPTSFVVLQGLEEMTDGQQKSVPVLGRMAPKLNNVKSVLDLPLKTRLLSQTICQALRDTYSTGLNLLATQNIIIDPDIMQGEDENGKERLFCDPDWYCNPGNGGINTVVTKTKFLTHFATRALLYQAASIIHKVTHTTQQPLPQTA